MVSLYISQTRSAYQLLEQAAGRLEIARGQYGKPFFPGRPDLHFNLSHSGGLALCALGDEPVGADIEWVRPRRAGLPRYALTPGEYGEFLARGGGWDAFYALWTRREAWVKYTGLGVARSRGREIPGALRLYPLEGEGWRGAVCTAGELGPLRWV